MDSASPNVVQFFLSGVPFESREGRWRINAVITGESYRTWAQKGEMAFVGDPPM